MSVECEHSRRTKDSEGHDCGYALEVGVVDCACVFGWEQAVRVRFGDRRGLVEEGLP